MSGPKSKAASRPESESREDPAVGDPSGLDPTWMLLGFLGFIIIGLIVYERVLDGPFISDDLHYVASNEILHAFDARMVREILDPTGVLTLLVENYAPVHLFLHAVEWQLFGPETTGYHLVNIVLHALASAMLVVLFVRTGLPPVAAWFGGALFLVHSANVEAVAWISQLKSPAAMVLAVGALLAHPRRPILATALFGLGLFAKPSALFALPVLVIWTWVERGREPGASERVWEWKWVAVWAVCLVAFAGVELLAFSQTAGTSTPFYEGTAVRFRSGVAIGARYVAMFTTTYGLSTFQEPPPVESWFDPWWLGAIPVFGLIGWRIVFVLRHRRIEAIFWAWAAASYSAVSGVLQLPFPLADRYLYSIMPGLIGAALWMVLPLRQRVVAAAGPNGMRVVAALGVLLIVAVGVRSHARSQVWTSPYLVLADTERNFPEGRAANTRRASRAARDGDVDGAIEGLTRAYARGYNRLDQILQDPSYGFMRDNPRFRSLIDQMADDLIERVAGNEEPSQQELHALAFAYNAKRETQRAIEMLEQALEQDGPISDRIAAELRELQSQQRLEEIRERARLKRESSKTP